MRIVIDWPRWSELPTRVMVTGVKRLDKNAASTTQKRLRPEQITRAVEMYHDGELMSAIGLYLGRSPSSTKRLMAQHIPPEKRRGFSESGALGRKISAARVHEKHAEAVNALLTAAPELTGR